MDVFVDPQFVCKEFVWCAYLQCMYQICYLIYFNVAMIILPATGARVCETRNITLQCRVIFNNVTVPGTWSRNGIIIDNDTLNHQIIFNSTEGLTNLIITNVPLADDNTEYMCSYSGGVVTPDNVTLHVAGMYVQYYMVLVLNIIVVVKRNCR